MIIIVILLLVRAHHVHAGLQDREVPGDDGLRAFAGKELSRSHTTNKHNHNIIK